MFWAYKESILSPDASFSLWNLLFIFSRRVKLPDYSWWWTWTSLSLRWRVNCLHFWELTLHTLSVCFWSARETAWFSIPSCCCMLCHQDFLHGLNAFKHTFQAKQGSCPISFYYFFPILLDLKIFGFALFCHLSRTVDKEQANLHSDKYETTVTAVFISIRTARQCSHTLQKFHAIFKLYLLYSVCCI